MSDLELHQWFEPDELDRCPVCGEPAGVTLPATSSFVCLGCGHVSTGAATESSEGTAPKP
jgi:ribosomal protein L37AE/L43A